MPFAVTMPKLSPTMTEGTLAKWHKKVGDKVEAGDLLIEVATDKATVEYNALDDGFLRKILVENGENAEINQPIAIFSETNDESIEGFEVKKPEPKKVDEEVTKGEERKQVPFEGRISVPHIAFAPEPPLENYEFAFPTGDKKTIASPLAKKIAKEKGLDLSTVKGSGPGGRVTSKDLDLAQKNQAVSFGRREKPKIAPGTFEEVPLTQMRKAIAGRLQAAKSTIPHIYVRQEIDALPLLEIQEQLKRGGLKVSINDFVIRASALSMKEHPHCNSGFNAENNSILLFKTIDISVAVSLPEGLITPIVRHTDYKNVGEISLEVKELAKRAKEGKLQPHEYKGGSFTVSNMGMFGVSEFSAIINPPQAMIVAVGTTEDCIRIKDGDVVPGKKMQLTLSVDHRVLDGVDAAKWIKTLQKYLENPALLLA